MNDEEIERRLKDGALRPQDEQFTRRVLAALPVQRPRPLRAYALRSFALATRCGVLVALLAAGQHWYQSGSEDRDTLLAILLCVVPVLAAVSYLCGPLMPVSLRRQLGRAARHWR